MQHECCQQEEGISARGISRIVRQICLYTRSADSGGETEANHKATITAQPLIDFTDVKERAGLELPNVSRSELESDLESELRL